VKERALFQHRHRVGTMLDCLEMERVTPTTTLAELRARIRAAELRGVDHSARLIRSVQQSLRVEGYDVRSEVLKAALRGEPGA
jgi:hypothetical protein